MTASPRIGSAASIDDLMNRAFLHTAVGCLCALAAGALVAGVRPFISPSPSPNKTTSALAPKTEALEKPAALYSDAFAETVRKATGAKRWLILLSAAEKGSPAELSALIRIAGNDSAVVRMLAARWAELDPRHMFDSLYADFHLAEGAPGSLPSRWNLVSILFEQWSKSDLHGAIKAMTDVPPFSARESLRMSLASRVMVTDVEAGLKVMKEWNVRNYLPDMKKVAEWAARDPRRAAESVLEFGRDYAGMEALKQVGKAWAARGAKDALEFASQLEPMSRATLSGEVIAQWAEKDLQAAIDFATKETNASYRAGLAQALVGVWGKSDPAAALAWSEQNLRGEARAEAISSLVKAAAAKDLENAAELVAAMEPGSAQNRACASIFETWFGKGKTERDAAFQWLAELPDPEARRAALERVQWNWMWQEPRAVREFMMGPYGHLASSSLIHQVARNEAAKNPESAMEWAGALGGERAVTAREAVLDHWLMIRPEGAMSYVRKMVAGAERERAIAAISQTMAYQSPQQAAEWYRQLSGAEQRAAREAFNRAGLPPDKRRELDEALGGGSKK